MFKVVSNQKPMENLEKNNMIKLTDKKDFLTGKK